MWHVSSKKKFIDNYKEWYEGVIHDIDLDSEWKEWIEINKDDNFEDTYQTWKERKAANDPDYHDYPKVWIGVPEGEYESVQMAIHE